jgi:acetyl-CoA acyltransferase 1
MAIRNIAHGIRAGEVSLGVAVGVESMSLKLVPLLLNFRRIASESRRNTNSRRFLFDFFPIHSPRPTPLVVDAVSANPQAHDCIQVRSVCPSSLSKTLVGNDNDDSRRFWQPMGWTSEMVAQTYNISRQKQDEYALTSHTRAAKVSFSLSFVLTFARRG